MSILPEHGLAKDGPIQNEWLGGPFWIASRAFVDLLA